MFFIFSALTSFVIIIAIYCILYLILPKKLSWISYLVLTLLLSVLAFRMKEYETDDLARYYYNINLLRDNGYDYLKYCFENKINNWDVYRVCGYYFYFISKFPSNNYLPAVTIFIVYGTTMLIIYNTSKMFNVSKFNTFLGSLFFLSTYWYYDTASGIRNGLAFAVVMVCAYYHLLLRKHIPLCFIGYLLACLMHSAAIMPVVFVIITVLTLNNDGKFMNFILVFGIVLGSAGIQFLSERSDNSFIQSIAGKAETNGLQDSLVTSTLYLTNVTTVIITVIIFIYFSYYLQFTKISEQTRRYSKYCSIILYFLIGSLYSPLIFMRFSRWIIPVIGATFIMLGSSGQAEHLKEKGTNYVAYYSPINDRIRYNLRAPIYIVIIAYTVIHFWYLCAGSSLNFIKF